MCGIAGAVALRAGAPPLDRQRFAGAIAALRHRGPDDAGSHLEDGVALGFRRLSIVDLAGGQQPLANEDRTIWVVHNGEIYNHAALHAELARAGHQFRTRSDAEALVHGYEAWGLDGLLGRLRGMFAFAIWDGRQRVLHAARDRFGIKPLHYTEHAGWFWWASEIRPLLAASGQAARLDLDGLALYLRIGFVPAPWTLFGGVRKLPAAHCLTVANGAVTTRCYWRLSYAPRPVPDERAVVAELRERIGEAVGAHLMGDVPVGALLSGGVDSGTVVSHMRARLPAGFPVLTIGFDEATHDERARAGACAAALGLPHTVQDFGGDGMESFPAIVTALEELSWSATFGAVHRLYAACRQRGWQVMLTGEGADELLGGYYWHWRRPMRGAWWRVTRPLWGAASAGRHPRVEQFVEWARLGEEGRRYGPRQVARHYLACLQVQRPDEILAVAAPGLRGELAARRAEDLLGHWTAWAGETGNPDPFQQILWLQSRTRLPDCVNTMVDRMSMAHSVEARPPFQDHGLWEFCAGLPRRLKVRGYYPHQTEKYLLREAGRGLVPEVVRTAPKLGLQVPIHRWVAQARLPDWAEEALSGPGLAATGLFDGAALGQLRRQAQAGQAKQQRLLMVAVAVQTWARAFDCRAG